MTVPVPGPPPRPVEPRVVDPRASVDAAMAGIDGLAGRPLAEHVEAFERVHAALSDALAAGSSGGTRSGATAPLEQYGAARFPRA